MNIRMKPALGAKWKEYCAEKGVGLSELPKQYIEHLVNNGKSLETYEMERRKEPAGPQIQLHMLVEPGVAEGIKKAASDLSWSQSKVVSKVMQCFFRKKPLINDGDKLMLNTSIDAVRSIMESIEEWTEMIGKHQGVGSSIEAQKLPESLAEMGRQVEIHCTKVEQFLDDQNGNWRLK